MRNYHFWIWREMLKEQIPDYYGNQDKDIRLGKLSFIHFLTFLSAQSLLIPLSRQRKSVVELSICLYPCISRHLYHSSVIFFPMTKSTGNFLHHSRWSWVMKKTSLKRISEEKNSCCQRIITSTNVHCLLSM